MSRLRHVLPLFPAAAAVCVVAVVVAARLRRDAHDGAPSAATTTNGAHLGAAGNGAPRLRAVPGGKGVVSPHSARTMHGDARRTHRARGRGPNEARVAWAFDTGGPVQAQVTVSPDERTLYAATLAGSLVALGRDGARKWQVPLGGRAYAAPCVGDDGTLYVGSDAQLLFAISPEGQVRWKVETQGDADTAPVMAKDGKVVFAAGAQVFAVRPGGDLAWRFSAKKKVFTAPALAEDGLVVFGAQDHAVYALGPEGKLAWSIDLGADVDGGPAIADDGAIYVGTDAGEVVRLDRGASDAGAPPVTVRWRVPLGGFVRGPLSIARNGDVLAGVYGPVPRQVRLEPEGGRVVGELAVQGTGAREFGVHGGALEDDEGTLFFGAQDDAVVAIGPEGETRFRLSTGADVDAPLTLLSDGTLVVASDDGKVRALEPPLP